MLVDERALQSLREDPVAGTLSLVRAVEKVLDASVPDEWDQREYDALIEFAAVVSELRRAQLLPRWKNAVRIPEVTGDRAVDCVNLLGFLREVETGCNGFTSKAQFETLQGKFAASFGRAFSYEFSAGDLERVQHLVNELRDQITTLEGLEDEHRQRILRRLERLQAELHKKMSDLDRFWGLVGDAGVVMAKLGKDAKPIVDRIRELAGIVWSTQARAEELPSGTRPPMLGHSDGDKGGDA